MIPVKYNMRNLFVRKGTTLMTLGSIGFVVLVYIGVLALAGGLERAFSASGDSSTVLVLRDGTRSEMESFMPSETLRILAAMPGVLRDDGGEPLASGETFTVQIVERGDGREANLSMRGVNPVGFKVRPEFAVREGRMLEPGKSEIMVGKNVASAYPSLAVGNTHRFGRLDFRVVGVFDSGGSYDSEVWGDAAEFQSTFRRENSYSSVRLRTASPSAARELIATAKGDQRLTVDPITETEYYQRQTETTANTFIILGNGLAVLMAFGACFAAANTMYSQVAARAREIGTLRAIGFQRRSIMAGFLIEAVLVGVVAGAFGALLSLPLNMVTAGTMNSLTFSEITFQLRTTPGAIFAGVFLATVTGIIGGLLPAFSASRTKITTLLREV